MPHPRHKVRLAPRTGGVTDINMLANQPTAKTHPHRHTAQNTMLDIGAVLTGQIGECCLFVLIIHHQLMVDVGPPGHSAAGVKFNGPAHSDQKP